MAAFNICAMLKVRLIRERTLRRFSFRRKLLCNLTNYESELTLRKSVKGRKYGKTGHNGLAISRWQGVLFNLSISRNFTDNSYKSLAEDGKNINNERHHSAVGMKRILRFHGLKIEEGHACFEVAFFPLCFGVKRHRNTHSCRIFINKYTGYFVCPKCDSSGPWNSLEQVLSSKKKGYTLSVEESRRLGIVHHSVIPKQVKEKLDGARCVSSILSDEKSPLLLNVQNLLAESGLKKINASSLKLFEAKVSPDCSCLIFPMRASSHGEIRGVKILHVIKSRTSNGEMENSLGINEDDFSSIVEETIPANNCQGLLGWTKSVTKKEAVLVASVRDALALSASISNAQVLCLPNGSSSLPQGLLPSLEPFSKITLWFGRNSNGLWDDPRVHARKLGEDRCYFVSILKSDSTQVNAVNKFASIELACSCVESIFLSKIKLSENEHQGQGMVQQILYQPTDSQPSAWEGMANGAQLGKLLCEARCIAHPSITTFEALREDVLAEIQNVEKVKGVKWARFPTLSRILHGHRRGELTVLTGPTGSGKTTFMSEYSLDLCQQGVSTLWGSFEIRNTRLARSMLQQMSGEPLEGMSRERFDEWAEKFSLLPLYFMTFHGQQSLKVVMETVSHAAYVHDIAHIVVDNVQFMLGLGESENSWGSRASNPGISDRFWRQDMVIAAFRRFATSANCHVTLVIHPRKERDCEDLTSNSIFGGVKASQEADNVLIIQDKRLSSVRGKKYLQVAKNRYSGDLGVMALEFDKESISYGKKKKLEVICGKRSNALEDSSIGTEIE